MPGVLSELAALRPVIDIPDSLNSSSCESLFCVPPITLVVIRLWFVRRVWFRPVEESS